MRIRDRIRRRVANAKEQASLLLRARSIAVVRHARTIAADAESVPGWVSGAAAREVAARSFLLGANPTIVEVGVFMGRSTVLLAEPRRLEGCGKVYCVDPFDCSGDDFSLPFYKKELEAVGAASLEEAFRRNIETRNLAPWVEVRKGTSFEIAANWTQKIDLLLLDGDHSPEGARASFDLWNPFLKPGGQIILHNTGSRDYAEGHDGNHRIAAGDLQRRPFSRARRVCWTTFAVKSG